MRGHVVVVVSATGHVMGTGVDCESGAPVGYTESDVQIRRASEAAWREVFDGCCHPDVAAAIDGLALRSISAKLIAKGWKEQSRPVEFAEAPE